MAKNDILTYEQVREMFNYDENTGILTWKVCRPGISYGRRAGCYSPSGYLRVAYNHKAYAVHRIIWLLYYKEWPKQQIDHINGIRDDNRICNLRDVSPRENTHNKQCHREGKRCGVFYNRWEKRWDSKIFYEGKQYWLGMYDTEEEALQAYQIGQEEVNSGIAPVYRKHRNKYRKNKKDIPEFQKSNYMEKIPQKPEIRLITREV